MNRDHLLHLAGQCKFSRGTSLAIAKSVRTPEDVERALATLTQRAARCNDQARMGRRASVVSVALAAAALFLCTFPQYLQVPQAWVLVVGAVAMIFGSVVYGLAALDRQSTFESQKKAYAPVVKSNSCKTALEYIEAGQPAVLAWRDLVVAERGVLREFDIMVMRDLHFAAVNEQKAAAARLENEQACRKLYGISYDGAAAAA